MANIDFFTCNNIDAFHFANFLRKTGELTKSGKHNIHWKCVLSNGTEKIPEDFDCVAKHKKTSSNSSMRHAHAIHDAIQKATSDYIIISDVDIALMYKDWDDEIVKILDEGHSCFGSPNSSNEYGEQDFPNMPFFAFKKEIIQKVDLDFRPILNENEKIKRVKAGKEKLDGRGIGELVFFETGCKLSSKFKKAGLKSKCLCLKPVHQESNETKILLNFKQRIKYINAKNNNKRAYHNHLIEFHHKEKLFLTHLGSSVNHNFKQWKIDIEKYLNDNNS